MDNLTFRHYRFVATRSAFNVVKSALRQPVPHILAGRTSDPPAGMRDALIPCEMSYAFSE